MSDPASIARARIAALKAEIQRLEGFLAMFDELAKGSADVRIFPPEWPGTILTGGNEAPLAASRAVDNFPPRVPRPRPSDIAELMARIIREIGRPMTRGQIVEALERRDVQIPYEDKARYVGTIAWRNKGMFQNIEGQGYWLRGEPLPQGLPAEEAPPVNEELPEIFR